MVRQEKLKSISAPVKAALFLSNFSLTTKQKASCSKNKPEVICGRPGPKR